MFAPKANQKPFTHRGQGVELSTTKNKSTQDSTQ